MCIHLTTKISRKVGAWHGIKASMIKWSRLQLKVIVFVDIKHPISCKIYLPFNNLSEVSINLA